MDFEEYNAESYLVSQGKENEINYTKYAKTLKNDKLFSNKQPASIFEDMKLSACVTISQQTT